MERKNCLQQSLNPNDFCCNPEFLWFYNVLFKFGSPFGLNIKIRILKVFAFLLLQNVTFAAKIALKWKKIYPLMRLQSLAHFSFCVWGTWVTSTLDKWTAPKFCFTLYLLNKYGWDWLLFNKPQMVATWSSTRIHSLWFLVCSYS